MSTEIKPGQVWAWNDTTAARGDHNAKFEIVDAAPHAPDVAYQYRDDAEIDPEQTFGAPAHVVAANATLVKDTTPAPLDPSKVQAGDTVTASGKTTAGGAYEITGEVWEPSHSEGSLWVGPVNLSAPAVTLTAHQPAPKKTPREQVVDILIDYSNTRADDYDTADRIIAALAPTQEQVDRVLRNYSTTITRPGTADFGALGHYTAEMVSLFGGESR